MKIDSELKNLIRRKLQNINNIDRSAENKKVKSILSVYEKKLVELNRQANNAVKDLVDNKFELRTR